MALILKNALFTLIVPGTVAGLVPWLISREHPPASGPALAAAVGLFTVGAATYLWCVWDFAAFGRGTPAPIDAPKKLVTCGPYRVVRNPMYASVLSVLLGWLVLYQTLALAVYALAVAIGFHLWVILYEEPRLRRRFGAEYEQYCARAGRWRWDSCHRWRFICPTPS